MNANKLIKLYRVSRSVNPTHRANAEHTRVSSGPVPLYKLFKDEKYINFTKAHAGVSFEKQKVKNDRN